MATSENLIPIPGRLHSVATEGHVSGADEIYDDSLQKDQATINQEVQEAIGTGGSVDSRIAAAINALDSEKSQTAGGDGLALSVTEVDGKITSISGSIAPNTYDTYGAATTAKTEVIGGATSSGNTLKKLEDRVSPLETAVGSGGSIDTRISNAVAAETAAREAADTALDGRIDTLEDVVEDCAYIGENDGTAVIADFDPHTDTVWKKAQTLSSADKAQVKTNLGLPQEIYSKTEVNELVSTPHQNYVTVSTYSELPASGSADTIYRVSNYDGTQVATGVYSEYAWNGSSYIFLAAKSSVGEVFDISEYHAGTKYDDLESALGTNGVNIPESLRKGGMSVKFVQNSDNKYVQYFLTKDEWSVSEADWEKVNLEEEVNQLGQEQQIIKETICPNEDYYLQYNEVENLAIETDGSIFAYGYKIAYLLVSAGIKYHFFIDYTTDTQTHVVLYSVPPTTVQGTENVLDIIISRTSSTSFEEFDYTPQYDGYIGLSHRKEATTIEISGKYNTDILFTDDVIDSLNLNSSIKPLSAKQGKVLNDRTVNISEDIIAGYQYDNTFSLPSNNPYLILIDIQLDMQRALLRKNSNCPMKLGVYRLNGSIYELVHSQIIATGDANDIPITFALKSGDKVGLVPTSTGGLAYKSSVGNKYIYYSQKLNDLVSDFQLSDLSAENNLVVALSVYQNSIEDEIETIKAELGDGAIDDLQAYINANRYVKIPNGTYVISETIDIPSNTIITGSGNTVLKLGAGCNTIFRVHGTEEDVRENIIIKNLCFEGDMVNVPSGTLSLNEIRERSAEGYDKGIFVNSVYQGLIIDKCEFRNFDKAGIQAIYTHAAPKPFFKKLKISNCEFHDNYYGLLLDRRSEWATVVGCTMAYNKFGVFIEGGNNYLSNNIYVQNYIGACVSGINNDNDSHGVISSSSFNHSSQAGIICIDVHNGFVFSNCICMACGNGGITLSNSKAIMYNDGVVGCSINIDSEPQNMSMFHNNIFRSDEVGGGDINGSPQYLSLTGNRFADGSSSSSINNNI